MTIRDSCNGKTITNSNALKLSLWLIPNEPNYTELKSTIDHLSQTYGLPTFEPHITLIGGEVIQNESEADVILKRLKLIFKDFGSIECSFFDKVLHGLNDDDVVKWNQSCVAILNPSQQFNDALYLAQKCFHLDDDRGKEKVIKHQFLKKGVPHFSFAYGMDDARKCEGLKPPGTFTCNSLGLYWTYPSCLIGVPQWKLIGEIFLT